MKKYAHIAIYNILLKLVVKYYLNRIKYYKYSIMQTH